MDPKKEEEIRRQISEVVSKLNLGALAHYARLLQTCGVRQPRVYHEFFLP